MFDLCWAKNLKITKKCHKPPLVIWRPIWLKKEGVTNLKLQSSHFRKHRQPYSFFWSCITFRYVGRWKSAKTKCPQKAFQRLESRPSQSLQYHKVMYKSRTWLEATLEYRPHFLQTQVAHKPHSNRAPRIQNGGPIIVNAGLHAKMLVSILKLFWEIHRVKFRFHCTCHRALEKAFTGFADFEHCIKAALEY